VPLVIEEERTQAMRAHLREDPSIITWAWTRVELTSAIERRRRAGAISLIERRGALDGIALLTEKWDEVTDLIPVRTRANFLLALHPLRAADAGQLAAALLVADQGLPGLGFVCLDQRLARAADLEGLRVQPLEALS
jgi:hypothetical protein